LNRERWIFAGALLVLLAGLILWQKHRERLMEACLEQGRTWNGPQSRCESPRIGPILKRALERT
jgi:hypothetical protein